MHCQQITAAVAPPSDIRGENFVASPTGVAALARLARSLAVAVMVIAGMANASPVTAAEAPAGFIRALGAQALAVLRSDAPLDRKAAYFHQMLRQDFDLVGISRLVLGPYWRVASPAQRSEFCHLLEDYIVRFDGARLASYGGESFRVTGSRSDADGVLVTSEVIRPQGPPIEIDWRLVARNGLYKISDLAIEGVSMALARRAEFAAIIERQGGQLEGLLALLRWKTGNPVFGPHTASLAPTSSDAVAEKAQ
jgi:phospholipid transport system substrate-binding protein